jgi:hypothetical protein
MSAGMWHEQRAERMAGNNMSASVEQIGVAGAGAIGDASAGQNRMARREQKRVAKVRQAELEKVQARDQHCAG